MTGPTEDAEIAEAVLAGLLASIRPSPTGRPRWDAAEPYLLRRAVGHAVEAGRLDDLLTDLEFLVHADPDTLLPHLELAQGDLPRRLASVYRASAGLHAAAPPAARRQLLSLDAARHGMTIESARLAAPQRVPLGWWSPVWSTTAQADPALVATIIRGAWVTALAAGTLGGRDVVVVGGSDHRLVVYDLATAQAIGAALDGHTDVVRAIDIAVVAGRTLVCSAGDDGTARLWDLRSGEPVPLGTGHASITAPGPLTAVALTNLDGRPTVLTGGADGVLRIWDVENGRARELSGHSRQVSAVTVGEAGGDPVAATAAWDDTARIWNLRSGAATTLRGHRSWVNDVALVRVAGRTHVCTAGNDDTVRLWDAGTGQPLLVLESPVGTMRTVAMTETGGAPAIAAAGVSGAVCWWDLSTSSPRPRLLTGHTGSVAAARISQGSGRPVVVTGGQDQTVRIWDPKVPLVTAPSEHAAAPSPGHTADVAALTVVRLDSTVTVASGDEDGTLCLWDQQGAATAAVTYAELGARPAEEYGAEGPAIHSLASGRIDDAPVLVIGRADGSLTVLELPERSVRFQLDAHVGPVSALVTVVVGGRAVLFSAGDDAVIQKRDLATGDLLATLPGHTDFVNALAITAEGALVSGSTDGTTRIWSVVDAVQLGPALHTDEDTVNCVTVVEQARPAHLGPIVVGSGDDGRLQFRDVPTGELLDSIAVSDQPIDALTTVAAPDGPVVVTGGADATLRTWDPITGGLLAARQLPDRIRALVPVDDGLAVAFGWEVAVLR